MAPISGKLADKVNPRRIISIGVFLITLGMIGCSIASEIWHFYLLFGVVIAIGNCLSGGPQFAPILARWFVKKRGTAIGLASSGVGFCFLFSSIAEFLISNMGLMGAYITLGLIPTALIIPLTLLFARNDPKIKGLQPDGAP